MLSFIEGHNKFIVIIVAYQDKPYFITNTIDHENDYIIKQSDY